MEILHKEEILVDEEYEQKITEGIQSRIRFSSFVQDQIDFDAFFSNAIANLIRTINTKEQWSALLYGGRSWNFWFSEFSPAFTKEESVSILKGNFDILIITSNPNYANSDEYLFIVKELTQLKHIANKRHLFDIYFHGHDKRRTIFNHSVAFFFDLMPKPQKRKTEETEVISERKLFVYAEIGIDTDVNIAMFKRFVVHTDHTNISLLGLFLFSYFLRENRSEKIVNIDEIRTQLFKKYRLKDMILQNRQSNILYFIIQLIFVIFPQIFTANYQNDQSNILNKLLINYNCIVSFQGKDVPYKTFLEQFNNDVLIDYQWNQQLPSLRQLLQWIITGIHVNNIDINCLISGGDAIRRYDKNKHTTNDIDSKLFYSKQLSKYEMIVISLLFILREYLLHNHYFKFSQEYALKIDNIPFKIHFHSEKQEYVTSIRTLLDFIKPLISLDMRLSYTISYGDSSITSKMYFSPLDVAFWKKSKILHTSSYFKSTPSKTPLLLYDNHYSTPIQSYDDIMEDLLKITTGDYKLQRIAVGKHQKDLDRLRTFQTLSPTVDREHIVHLEQLTGSHASQRILTEWTTIIAYVSKFFNSPPTESRNAEFAKMADTFYHRTQMFSETDTITNVNGRNTLSLINRFFNTLQTDRRNSTSFSFGNNSVFEFEPLNKKSLSVLFLQPRGKPTRTVRQKPVSNKSSSATKRHRQSSSSSHKRKLARVQ